MAVKWLGHVFKSWQILSQPPHFIDSSTNPVKRRVMSPSKPVSGGGLEIAFLALDHGSFHCRAGSVPG